MLMTERPSGLDHLATLQQANGCWEGEMVWCSMITSQYIIVRRIVGRPFTDDERAALLRYYETHRTADGVWGLHPESAGYVFTTALAYVALRMLGVGPDEPLTANARRWLHAQPGGVLAIPTWGKFWLALIGLYGWRGVNSSPPELFLLPRWLPFHPARYYCHTRYIYLAMAQLHGQTYELDGIAEPLRVESLRAELYAQPYSTINFAAHRSTIAASDLYVRPGWLLRTAQWVLSQYERWPVRFLRWRAQNVCFQRVVYEQRASNFEGLSPVNGLLNCLILGRSNLLHQGHPDTMPSLNNVESWRWEDEAEGRRYAGARSQTWDTAFALQALLAGPDAAKYTDAIRRGYRYLRHIQSVEELPDREREGRDAVLGGWCFSDGRHRWPVSDCTAEALSVVLAIHARPELAPPASERISDERLRLAVNFILRRQNADGGFGTYERRRGSGLLERLNPSEMYGQCMTELSYLECTASSVAALAHYRAAYPGAALDAPIQRGVQVVRRYQRADGSFPGFWGINFTYGAFHAVRGLRAVGVPASDPALQRAAAWLQSKQRPDGGWGEHFSSCLTGQYVEHAESQAVMTSWALLALLEVLPADTPSIARGIAWLRNRQQLDGGWPKEAVNGVFFGTAMLDYRLYKSYFPAWALARFAAVQR